VERDHRLVARRKRRIKGDDIPAATVQGPASKSHERLMTFARSVWFGKGGGAASRR
jgi:hypothetical protein